MRPSHVRPRAETQQTDLKTQRPVILYNQDPGILVSLLRSTNSPPPCADARPPARRPAPRTWRLGAVLPSGFAAGTRRERSHPVRLSRRRSTVHPRATDPWGYPSHPGPPGRQDRSGRPYRADPHAEAPSAFCPPTPRVTHSGPCLPQAASPQRLRRGRFAPAASPRRFAPGRPVPIGTIVTCVRGIPYPALRFSASLLSSA